MRLFSPISHYLTGNKGKQNCLWNTGPWSKFVLNISNVMQQNNFHFLSFQLCLFVAYVCESSRPKKQDGKMFILPCYATYLLLLTLVNTRSNEKGYIICYCSVILVILYGHTQYYYFFLVIDIEHRKCIYSHYCHCLDYERFANLQTG